MDKKVVLVLVDGMRPDGIEQCGNPYLLNLRDNSTASFKASSIMPSVTLPCHTTLFLSVDPNRHGITTNTWVPQVRPIDGICDVVCKYGKKAAMVYDWEPLRDLSRPLSLEFSFYQRQVEDTKRTLQDEIDMTKLTIDYIKKETPDFLFLYLGAPDEVGHHYGWMGKEYLESLDSSSNCIKMLKESLPEEYQLIITADHGGHDRTHGTEMDEDMVIPMIFNGTAFEKGKVLDKVNLKDIAPTITKLLGLQNPPEWEGNSVI